MQTEKEAVVIVHGIWMHDIVMRLLGRRLRHAGFRTYFFNYSSRGDDIRNVAPVFRQWLESRVAERKVHFVAHSLGGLVVFEMLARMDFSRLGRVVTLGSPLNGSAVAQRLSQSRFGRWLLDGALSALCLGAPELAANISVGAVVGTLPVGLGRCLAQLPLPHDGTVTVAEGTPKNCADSIAMPVSHFGMLVFASVASQTVHFLRQGTFSHSTENGRR